MFRVILAAATGVGSCAAHAALVTLDFNDYDLSQTPYYNTPGYSYLNSTSEYTREWVTLASEHFIVGDTRWMQDSPDAVLASPALNGSGLLWTAYRPIEVTAEGELFSLESVDILKGLDNYGMSVRMEAFRHGVLTRSLDVRFIDADPTNMMAFENRQSWLLGFSGRSLGMMDRLRITGIENPLDSRWWNDFFLDNLVVSVPSVPEPGPLGLIAVGIVGTLVSRRPKSLVGAFA